MTDYRNGLLETLPAEVADSLLDMALVRTKLARADLASLSDADRRRLDETLERLVTAADVPDTCCGH